MKILEKEVKVLYRFRCNKCRSKFEMTKDEKTDNDWAFNERKNRKIESGPWNPLDKFKCPVCKNVRYMRDLREIHVMNNGNEDWC